MQYRILGPVEVRRDGAVIDLGVYKQRALLALLLINANEVVSTDRIIDELWEDGGGRDRQNALWTVVSRLRAILEPDRPKRTDGTILRTQPPGYVLTVDRADVDAARFESLASEGRALLETDPAAASLVLSEGLALWRGHALEEFTYTAFAMPEIERLEELRLAAVEDRIDADLRTGRARELISELESLVGRNPFRQRLVGHLMLALHLSGRQGDALRVFGNLREGLADELGLDPSPALTQLEERIVLDDPSLRATSAARSLTGRAEPGLSVRGYELRDKLGESATGLVYAAFQPTVGREVAIKVIRPEFANDPEFIRRFEADAQLIASLEHPQIVPVFDYWREPDAAFMVMRRFDGNLREVLETGPTSTADAVAALSQVGGALAAAHRRGIIHGDVRAENVLLDGEGNAHLGGFALPVHDPAGSAPVSAAGADGDLAGERADIAAFADLARRTLEGATGDGVMAEAPLVGPAAAIIERAIAADPDDSFTDIASFLDALADAFDETPLASPGDADADVGAPNPYCGLRAFAERDAERFFGRERLVERLLTRLGNDGPRSGLVALVGPSGSGKSSIVRAGLIPALRRGATVGSDRWFIVSMTPGSHPFESLDEALRSIAVHPRADSLERLRNGGISSAVESAVADATAETLIIVDQLEELFSHASSADADAFLDALVDAATDRHSHIKLIATLRADFYDQPLRHRSFGELLRLGTEVITPMNAQELERAITAPAAEVGVSFEPGLVASIMADMAGHPNALPLLQYALTELFEQRRGRLIGVDVYREIGGISAALARRAESLYGDLGEDERVAVHQAFLRLVSIDESSADTRRRALLSELTDVAGPAVSAPLESFGRHRLLSFDRDPLTRSPSVEIAHEALLGEWSRLQHWIDDAHSDLVAQRRLAQATQEWSDRDRHDDFLLSGARLSRHAGWLDRPPVRLTTLEHDYLAASHGASQTELRVERDRVRRLRRLVAGVGTALVLALVAGSLAFAARQQATEEAARADAAAEDAELATLVSRAAAARVDDPELGLLLALEAHERHPGPATEQAVLSALSGAALGGRIASWMPLVDDCVGIGVVRRGLGGVNEIATVDGRMVARDLVTGEIRDAGPPPGVCAVGYRTDSEGAAVRGDGSLIWLGADFEVEVAFDTPTFPTVETPDRVAVVTFAGDTNTISVLDRATGDQLGPPHTSGFLSGDALSADGGLMAFAFSESNTRDDGTLLVVEPDTGAAVSELVVPDAPTAITFDPATGDLVAALRGGAVIRVDPLTGEFGVVLDTGQVVGHVALGFHPDGRLILVARDSITVADVTSGEQRLAVELQSVAAAIVTDDGLVVTSTDKGRRDVYDVARSALVEQQWEADGSSAVAAFDGAATLVSRTGDLVEIVDLATGERAAADLRFGDGTPFVPRAMWAEPDGAWAVNEELVLGRWVGNEMVDRIGLGSDSDVGWFPYGNLPSGTRLGSRYAVLGARSDPAGSIGDQATEAILVELTRGDPTVVMRIETDGFWAHPTAEGGMVVADRSGALRTYDTTGTEVGEPIATGAEPYAMTMSADGTILAMGSLGAGQAFEESTIVVVEMASGETHTVPVEGLVSTLGITDDGRQIVLAMFDGTVRIYDVEQRNVPTIVYDGSGAFTSQPGWYDAETGTMWIHSDAKLLQIPVGPDRWIERACSVVSRQLTPEEWDRLVPGDEPVRAACP